LSFEFHLSFVLGIFVISYFSSFHQFHRFFVSSNPAILIIHCIIGAFSHRKGHRPPRAIFFRRRSFARLPAGRQVRGCRASFSNAPKPLRRPSAYSSSSCKNGCDAFRRVSHAPSNKKVTTSFTCTSGTPVHRDTQASALGRNVSDFFLRQMQQRQYGRVFFWSIFGDDF